MHDFSFGEPGPIRIVPIGDSITQGGKALREEYTYRFPLFQMLTDAGIPFEFVGSMTSGLNGNASWPDYKGIPFDARHEGVYGIRTAAALNRLPKAMKKWHHDPDIALVYLGHNDQNAGDYLAALIEPLRGIINLLRERNPAVVVFLGQIHYDSPKHKVMHSLVEVLAGDMSTDESPVRTVPLYQGFNPDPAHARPDTFDWAHPNPAGQRKIAEHFLKAMLSFLPSADSHDS